MSWNECDDALYVTIDRGPPGTWVTRTILCDISGADAAEYRLLEVGSGVVPQSRTKYRSVSGGRAIALAKAEILEWARSQHYNGDEIRYRVEPVDLGLCRVSASVFCEEERR